jgi:tetratricopeptide (TPR) repeat protein
MPTIPGPRARVPRHRGALAAVLAAALAAGCASTTPAPGSGADADGAGTGETPTDGSGTPEAAPERPVPEGARPVEPEPPAPVYGNFDSETLYELLVAEMALRRGEYEPALERYGRQARRTRDPGVVAKAARLAAVTRRDARARELALLWADVAPGDPDARQAAAVALVRAGDFEGALGHLSELRRLGGEAGFGYLAVNAADVEPETRAGLLRALDELQARWPEDDEIAFARAVLLEREGRTAEALVALDALEEADYGTDAILLRGRLLEALGDLEGAVDWLRAALARGGETGRLRYVLARLLVDVGDLDGARVQFERLLERVGDNAEILLSLALITLELDRTDAALGYLDRLVEAGRRPDSAHYYLGVVRQRRGETAAAVEAWRRVTPGFEYRRAQAAAAEAVLAEGDAADLRAYLDDQRTRHPDEALMLWLLEGQTLVDAGAPGAAIAALDAAVARHGPDPDLLYARAMAHDANGDLAGLERDLRAILERDPDDAMALNALGYTIGNRTDRLEEARALVERALAQSPDEPAYIDSLGWIEYRAGNLDRAVELLRRAFAGYANAEVAAHLGEALHALGEDAAAREVWVEGLTLEPPLDVLEETVRRRLGDDGLAELEREAEALDAP